MRRLLLGVPLIAVVLLAIAASTADACYCGAARYRCCQMRVLRTRSASSSAARS